MDTLHRRRNGATKLSNLIYSSTFSDDYQAKIYPYFCFNDTPTKYTGSSISEDSFQYEIIMSCIFSKAWLIWFEYVHFCSSDFPFTRTATMQSLMIHWARVKITGNQMCCQVQDLCGLYLNICSQLGYMLQTQQASQLNG